MMQTLTPMHQATSLKERMNPLKYDRLVRQIKAQAGCALAQYPQYLNYHDGDEWVLVRIAKDVTSKGGPTFTKGEYTLARAEEIDERERPFLRNPKMTASVIAWSALRSIHASVSAHPERDVIMVLTD